MRRKMIGFEELTPLSEALEKLRRYMTHRITETEIVSLEESHGRILAEDITATISIPDLNRSAVDGYAVIAEDTFGATPNNPVTLRLVGKIMAGARPDQLPRIRRGETAEIMTGAPLPDEATAVVMAEHARQTNSKVEVTRQVTPYQNVSRMGEDYPAGSIIAKKQTRIMPWHIAALAGQNITSVKVLRRPRAAIISTGNELVMHGMKKNVGEVIDTNRPMLKALLETSGAEPIDLGISPDSTEELRSQIMKGLSRADMVIITGGTSIGETDNVPDVVSSLGEPGIIIHGLRIRPAKPTGVGIIGGKPIFMLSGFPVSAYIGYKTLVEPCISMMTGTRMPPPPRIRGRLTRRVAKPQGIRAFVRVRVRREGESYIVEPMMLTGSGLLSTLTGGNGILEIPEMLEGHDEGEVVEVEITQPLEGD